jgi:hypothetical protein
MSLCRFWPNLCEGQKRLREATCPSETIHSAGSTELVFGLVRGRIGLREVVAAGAAVMVTLSADPARAWIYAEHREIGLRAWAYLTPTERASYAALWNRARDGYSSGLCQVPVSGQSPSAGPSAELTPCVDFAAWPAIAADHSCSPDQLINDTLRSSWVHDVARVSERVRADLANAQSPSDRENVWLTSNLRLQEVDDDYVTRAGANSAHFLLPLAGDSLTDFIQTSTLQGAPLNALGLYVQYHTAALHLARSLGPDLTMAPSRSVRQLLALEAYALHFLQDAYSSGHITGTWGDAPVRKGTHDYYCAHGYATTTWSGKNIVVYGDAHMRKADLERSGAAMAKSMGQVLAATHLGPSAGDWHAAVLASAALDSCQLLVQPPAYPADSLTLQALEAVLAETPIPGHGPDSVSLPRYRADFGPFIGIESTVSGGIALAGYGSTDVRAVSELGMVLRLGYGLEDVVGAMNSGTMFVSLGVLRQSDQVDECGESCGLTLGSPALPRVPSRAGFSAGIRLPFWLIPGDLLVLTPVLALASPKDLTRVAMRAASGGLIPWQRTISTPLGYFEFVAGRGASATFFGTSSRVRTFAWTSPEQTELASIGFRSVLLTFPVLEYTPLRMVSQDLTASLQIQFAYAIDIPYDMVNYTESDGYLPDWGPVHQFLIRLGLNGRRYF